MTVDTALLDHVHMWRIAEVEFVDSHAVHRYECSCGAADFVYLS